MRSPNTPSLVAAIALAILLALGARMLGAPWSAALLASLGSFGATLATIVLLGSPAGAQQPTNPARDADESPLPEATLDELIDAIDDPCLLVVDRRVARANAAAREVLGDHIVGEDVRLAIRHPAASERLIGRGLASEAGGRTAIELVGIGARDRRWELVVHELSNRARFARLADRSRTYAAEQMRVDFVANASHELRTPLASLLGYIETLQDPAADDEKETRARFLQIMHGQAIRMRRLIDDLISLSRIEGEKYRLPEERIEFETLVDEASEAACASLGEDFGRLEISHGERSTTIVGDSGQLAQLVNNLVANAIKYGRASSRVRIATQSPTADLVRLTVQDEGEGVPPEHLPRLTERFYRVDTSRSRAMGGTGLGLAIVKHIVERHRGRLSIDSKLGRGTRVTVDLPTDLGPLSSRRNDIVTQSASNDSREPVDLI